MLQDFFKKFVLFSSIFLSPKLSAGDICGSNEGSVNRFIKNAIPDHWPGLNADTIVQTIKYFSPEPFSYLSDLVSIPVCASYDSADLAPSCLRHDSCYEGANGSWGKSQWECDRELEQGWRKACEDAYEDEFPVPDCESICKDGVSINASIQRNAGNGFVRFSRTSWLAAEEFRNENAPPASSYQQVYSEEGAIYSTMAYENAKAALRTPEEERMFIRESDIINYLSSVAFGGYSASYINRIRNGESVASVKRQIDIDFNYHRDEDPMHEYDAGAHFATWWNQYHDFLAIYNSRINKGYEQILGRSPEALDVEQSVNSLMNLHNEQVSNPYMHWRYNLSQSSEAITLRNNNFYAPVLNRNATNNGTPPEIDYDSTLLADVFEYGNRDLNYFYADAANRARGKIVEIYGEENSKINYWVSELAKQRDIVLITHRIVISESENVYKDFFGQEFDPSAEDFSSSNQVWEQTGDLSLVRQHALGRSAAKILPAIFVSLN